MRVVVSEASQRLEPSGLLERGRGGASARVIEHVRELLGRELPADLVDFYRERIVRVGEFYALTPVWNEHAGWRTPDALVTRLLHADAVPLFDDGSGNFHGLDMTKGVAVPAVYFFDHVRRGASAKWELGIDPDLEKCPRAPAIWSAS